MATNKKDEPSTHGSAPTETKPATSTESLAAKNEDHASDKQNEEQQHLDSVVADLDSVLTGGCSTCGSKDHDDEDCEHESDSMYMMSTALPPSAAAAHKTTTTTTSTSTTTASSSPFMSTLKGGSSGCGGQGCGRRNCCK